MTNSILTFAIPFGVFCVPRIVGADGRRVVSVPDIVKRWWLPKGERGRGDIVLWGERGMAGLLDRKSVV